MKYNVVTPIEAVDRVGRKQKTRWHKIGRAWSDEEEPQKICVVLDSIPFRSEFIYLMEADRDHTTKSEESGS